MMLCLTSVDDPFRACKPVVTKAHNEWETRPWILDSDLLKWNEMHCAVETLISTIVYSAIWSGGLQNRSAATRRRRF